MRDTIAERAKAIEALRQHRTRSWAWVSLGLWLSVGILSLWSLRFEFQELREYFTWAAVRYMLYFNRLAALGLAICLSSTISLLFAESRHILLGLSKGEKRYFTRRLEKIYEQGASHPAWKIIHPRK